MKPILLVGTGPMAVEYAKVLRDGLERPFVVCGRTPENVTTFAEREGAMGRHALSELTPEIVARYEFAIVTTSRDSLAQVSELLSELGMKTLLIEKPAAISVAESRRLVATMARRGVTAKVAFNRRYYQATRGLHKALEESAPVAANFDFTELAARMNLTRPAPVLESWAYGNSIHVFDTVVFLLGAFTGLEAQIGGQGELAWHPSGATFVGKATCGGRVPVTYCTSWVTPGRWEIQVFTRSGRYKLAPMERLQVLKPGTFDWSEVPLDYSIDTKHKPGLLEMVRDFDTRRAACDLPDLSANTELLDVIARVVGYPQ